MAETLYAVMVKWRARRWLVVSGPYEWAPYILRRDPIGDHARWLRKMAMKYPRQWGVTERIGPWPIGLIVPAPLSIEWVDIDFLSELAGLGLAAWAIYHTTRRAIWPQQQSRRT